MWKSAKAGPVTMKKKMTAQSRLESPWSKSSHILNNVSVWTVEFLNRNTLEWLQRLDLQIYVYSKILVFFNQVLKPIRELPKTKRFNPKLFLAEPSEKNHAEFERDFSTFCFKTAKPRETFHLSSASLRSDFFDYSTFASPYLDKISLKSPLFQSLF